MRVRFRSKLSIFIESRGKGLLCLRHPDNLKEIVWATLSKAKRPPLARSAITTQRCSRSVATWFIEISAIIAEYSLKQSFSRDNPSTG
jgi:hypothetical protein